MYDCTGAIHCTETLHGIDDAPGHLMKKSVAISMQQDCIGAIFFINIYTLDTDRY